MCTISSSMFIVAQKLSRLALTAGQSIFPKTLMEIKIFFFDWDFCAINHCNILKCQFPLHILVHYGPVLLEVGGHGGLTWSQWLVGLEQVISMAAVTVQRWAPAMVFWLTAGQTVRPPGQFTSSYTHTQERLPAKLPVPHQGSILINL